MKKKSTALRAVCSSTTPRSTPNGTDSPLTFLTGELTFVESSAVTRNCPGRRKEEKSARQKYQPQSSVVSPYTRPELATACFQNVLPAGDTSLTAAIPSDGKKFAAITALFGPSSSYPI